ncbi:MAG TPA: universal stress protein [Thermoleophilaceae bacterium]|jgi:nucleotide-binding universal stress UspA family protein
MADTAQILVVANQTAESDELLEALKERAGRSPAKFHLLVPATPHGASWAMDMHSGGEEAEEHLKRAVQRYRDAGIDVDDGKIGDPDPLAAVEDAVNFKEFDEIVCSTLPRHVSKWLKLDLPHRVERATGKPVTHVEAKSAKDESGLAKEPGI